MMHHFWQIGPAQGGAALYVSHWDGGVIVFRENWLYTALIYQAKFPVMKYSIQPL